MGFCAALLSDMLGDAPRIYSEVRWPAVNLTRELKTVAEGRPRRRVRGPAHTSGTRC